MTLTPDAFLARHTDEVQKLTLRLREVVRAAFPSAIETLDVKEIGFGYDAGYKGLVCTLSPQSSYVNLGLFDAVALPDPAGLLEGTGKRHRHVKVRDVRTAESAPLRALLTATVAARRPPKR